LKGKKKYKEKENNDGNNGKWNGSDYSGSFGSVRSRSFDWRYNGKDIGPETLMRRRRDKAWEI
jgi:hypothetical protein